MLKLLLCVGAFSLCLLLAWLLTRKYRLRKDFYYNLSLFNERLYNEVSYTREPLPSFIEKQPFGGDFKKILTERSANGFRPGDCAIPYLKEDETQVFGRLFEHDREERRRVAKNYLASRRAEVEARRQASEEAYKKHFSLYIKLGVLAGLVLVILIV